MNESINYSSPSPMGSVLATVGPELLRELDTEDALYRANYVEINYSFRWQYAILSEHMGKGVFLSLNSPNAVFFW